MKVGLDVGFGDVKVVAGVDGKDKRTKFPSAIAYARDGIIGDLGEDGRAYLYNGKKYVVGSSALETRDVFSTRDLNFLLLYSPLLAYVGLKELGIGSAGGGEVSLCLGVPLAYFHTKRFELAESMKRCEVSGEALRFDSVEIRAQGQGILFDFMLDGQGKPMIQRLDLNLLIVDIGFNTVDILAVVDGRPSRAWSDMIERGGVGRICEQLGYYLKAEHGFDLAEQSIKEVLQSKRIKLYGAEKDLSSIVRVACEEYSDWLIREISSRWGGFLKRADGMIVAGGGAYYVGDEMKDRYPLGFVSIPEGPEYANARGFYKYLVGKEKEGDDEQ